MGKFITLKLINRTTNEYVQIVPQFAGNLTQVVLLSPQNTLVSVVDGYETEAELLAHKGYKSAKLLPFPNRLANGCYTFGGQSYQLPINRPTENHAIHGLFYNESFEVSNLKRKKNSISLQLTYHYKGNMAAYPFECVVKLRYRLSRKGLMCQTTVVNVGDTALPFGDGWHPYFRLNDTPLNECLLQLPACKQLTLDKRNLPTGNLQPNTQFATLQRIEDTHLDNGYVLSNYTKKARTIIQHPTQQYQLHVWQQANKKQYNYLQIYTPPHRQSIAVEPMSCAANAFNNRMGLITLQPKQRYKAKYGIQLKKTTN